MQSIIIWGRQIFIVCIISNIFIRLVPSQKYEKYIKYICGIILLVICITPVLELFNSSFSQIYEKFQNGSGMDQLKNELRYTSTAGSAMLDSYIAKVEKNVDTFTLEEGLYPVSTQIIIDEDEQSDSFGNIQGMKLVVSMAKAKDSEDTYKNTKDNISIEIEKIRIKENDVIKDDTVAQQISDLKRKLSEMYNISEDVIDIVYE